MQLGRTKRPKCHCGKGTRSKGRNHNGQQIWAKMCYSCMTNYQMQKGKVCEYCGFIPTHKCQLDVDHIDGDRSNNHPSNLQTLCANCHRLKTHLNNDYLKGRDAIN